MVRKFKVKVNGEEFNVEVEELNGQSASGLSSRTASPKAQSETGKENTAVSKEVSNVVSSNSSRSKESANLSGKKIVSAPLPGKIISVNVKKGDSVKKGDLLLVLEAMKMENEIFASTDGTIVDILVSPGDYVSTGDKMIVME